MGDAFTVEFRDEVRARILARARGDPRILGGAIVGSGASGNSDRWSDLDLTFGLVEGVPPAQLLDEWTPVLARELGAVHLFDLARQATLYRVFLFPGALQVDLSFTTGSVPQYGPEFHLLFGGPVRPVALAGRTPEEIFGYAVHHAVRARVSIERGRPLQAEHWIRGVRDEALALACHRRGLNVSHARGYDQLPKEVTDRLPDALARSFEPSELRRALGRSVDLLLREADGLRSPNDPLATTLRRLDGEDWD